MLNKDLNSDLKQPGGIQPPDQIAKGDKVMSAKDNIKLVQDMYEALNAQALDDHDKYWTEDMIWHGPPGFGDIHGREGFKYEVLKPFYTSFPDYHVVNEIEIADENWVAATGILTGTHQADWEGHAPTKKPVSMRFSDFWLVKDGKLTENFVMVDNLATLKNIGATTIDWKYPDERPLSKQFIEIFNKSKSLSGSAKQNLELIHKMMDVMGSPDKNKDAQKEFWTEDMAWHGPAGFGEIYGFNDYKNIVLSEFYGAFPDYHATIDIELAEENWAAATGFITGTHQGSWLEIAPTGKPIKMKYSNFWLIKDGKIAHSWVMLDQVSLLEQLGIDHSTDK